MAANGEALTNGINGASQSTQTASQPSQQPIQTILSAAPQTSLQDNGTHKRPRDARLIHMLLSSLSCTAYQERVPLQLLDFAYRHSSSILSDALHLSSDAYLTQQARQKEGPTQTGETQVTAQSVQLAIGSRLQYQFGGGVNLGKETLAEIAEKRNKVALPRVLANEWGVRLPSERFVLSGQPWALKGEWKENEEDPLDAVQRLGDETQDVDMDTGEDPEGGIMEDLFGAEGDEGDEMDMDREPEP